MIVLSFDTCWSGCSAAICRFDGGAAPTVLAHRLERMSTGQAEALPQMLKEVLERACVDVADLNRIAVPVGPGSFTGIRISIATARALALLAPVELVTCSSLALIAAGIAGEGHRLAKPVMVAMDGRNDQAYVQIFDDDVFGGERPPQLLSYTDAAEMTETLDLELAGTAAAAIADVAAAQQLTVRASDPVPDALDLCRAAGHLAVVRGPLMPLYLRPPDAKVSSKPAIARVEHAD
jgi:tRNA threonylcarbamoyladenosine biosynthesis protein TsaB